MRIPWISCLAALLWITTSSGDAQDALAPERALAREIFRELIEIPTTEADGATPRAAQAMADRLLAAGFPREDVRLLSPNPRVGNLVARFRGNDSGRPAILLMAHIDVVPALREDSGR